MASEPDKKQDALKTAIKYIEEHFGKGSIMKLGAAGTVLDVECLDTGSISLNLALGGKGIPRGRVVEVFGPEASGKTTLCLSIIAQAQRKGGTAVYVDAEHAVDPSYANKVGVDTQNLYLSQPDSGEQALNTVETLVRSNAVDVIVVDSVAALVPRSELEGEMGDIQVGAQARLMSQALRKLAAIISKSKTSVIFINQVRERIQTGGPYAAKISGQDSEVTPGGRALKFYASVRIRVRKGETIRDSNDIAIGNRVKAQVVKNKVAPPFRTAEFDLMFSHGISREGDLLDLGEKSGFIERSGNWFTFKGTKMGPGREKAREFLRQNSQIAGSLESEILRYYLDATKAPPDQKKPQKR
jgi:recombination protein RecA